ncbi:PREDICTED: putative RING-H2 finger protein ATL71 isoform X1 [Ipomoea nil]|uniref:putative RING-H2 finger protein ATL71 isoform X1 n=1 Tax=Ipomoea nil TaxID=35883 RepID=UPI0009008F0A|nr:PREDICTED: putative RING-H2 finger protein ATL71 isoform X1 [Ipomoea nil]
MMDNNTMVGGDSGDDLGEQRSSGGFGYSIGFSVGILLILVLVTYFSYVCVKARPGNASRSRRAVTAAEDDDDERMSRRRLGLDEATLESYPKLVYSQAKQHEGDSAISSSSGCSICLADYKDADILRLLPDCGHLFHSKCVDPWLRLRPTCPICRNSPLPSPLLRVEVI